MRRLERRGDDQLFVAEADGESRVSRSFTFRRHSRRSGRRYAKRFA
jgi:hypothetical protein